MNHRAVSTTAATLFVAAVLLGAPRPARAYDNKFTHRWITREAVARLVAAYPGQYDELAAHVDDVAFGAEDEDNYFLDGDTDPTTLRVQRHFFRPTDEAGLTMSGRTFPSSYEWTAIPNEQNEWDWGDGLRRWRAGDKKNFYVNVGHVVHLIQDATVPAHTHLDIHGPPKGDTYEDYCTSQMIDEHTSRLPVPPDGAAIPLFADAHDAWTRTAWASWRRNLYPGDLSNQAQAGGTIAAMFPDLSFGFFSQNWSIGTPSVGALDAGFFEHAPGEYYFKIAAFPAALDKVAFDTEGIDPDVYGDPAGEPMVAGFARDLVPLAILNSAGVMKLYLDTAAAQTLDPVPPAGMPDSPDGATSAAGCSIGSPSGSPSSSASGALGLLAFALVALRFAPLSRRHS